MRWVVGGRKPKSPAPNLDKNGPIVLIIQILASVMFRGVLWTAVSAYIVRFRKRGAFRRPDAKVPEPFFSANGGPRADWPEF